MGQSWSFFLFLYFWLFNSIDSKQVFDKSLPMTRFKPQISGIGGDRSTNCATTTALLFFKWAILGLFFFIFVFLTVISEHVHYKVSPMTSNRGPLVLEATALPTEPQPPPYFSFVIFSSNSSRRGFEPSLFELVRSMTRSSFCFNVAAQTCLIKVCFFKVIVIV